MISYFPTPEHAEAAEAITTFFGRQPETEAVVLVNSCARGKATVVRWLRARWRPYYSDDLRDECLVAFRDSCRFHLDHIPLYIERQLYFQSFDRLYTAFGLFLQALFIARRTYPISYNKWIREQVEEILGLPALYRRLPRLLEIERFESCEMIEKERDLPALLEEYAAG